MRENTWWELTTFAYYHYVTLRCVNLENTPDILIEHFIDGVIVGTVDSPNISDVKREMQMTMMASNVTYVSTIGGTS